MQLQLRLARDPAEQLKEVSVRYRRLCLQRARSPAFYE